MNTWGYIVAGILAALIGLGLVYAGAMSDSLMVWIAAAFLTVGAVLLPIGVIAEGVRIGMREAR